MQTHILTRAKLFLLTLFLLSTAQATVTFNRIYGEGMVLQSGMDCAVKGFADPDEMVTVSFSSPNNTVQTKQTTADANGNWLLYLDPLTVDTGSGTLTAQGASNTVTANNVLVGEVWVFTGQSNMDRTVGSIVTSASISGYDPAIHDQYVAQAIAVLNEADNPATRPLIRIFNPGFKQSLEPQKDLWAGSWTENTRANVESVSAVAYYCCQELARNLPNTPIALLDINRGGSHIQSWIPYEYAFSNPDLAKFIGETYDDFGDSVSPSKNFNKMIAPLAPFTMRGTLWFQGESAYTQNSSSGRWQYAAQLPQLIQSWRDLWGQDQFHFGIIRILSSNAEFCNSQMNAARIMKDAAYIDIRDVQGGPDVHFLDKIPVGNRSAWWMLNTVYGQNAFPASGPLYKTHSINGNEVTVTFDHVGQGLKTSNGLDPAQFEVIASLGDSTAWKSCDSVYIKNGNQVVVSSSSVSTPVAVRLNYGTLSDANLESSYGWPACQFSTANQFYTWLHPEFRGEIDSILLWPLNGDVLGSGEPLTIQAMANYDDSKATVDHVNLYINGQLQGKMDYVYNRFYEKTVSLSDGYHSLRLEAVSGTATNITQDSRIYVGSNPEFYTLNINGGHATGKYLPGQLVYIHSRYKEQPGEAPFVQWTGDTSFIDDANSHMTWLTMPSQNVQLTANFVGGVTHTITGSAGTGGTISPIGAMSVTEGTVQQCYFLPDPGYQVADIKIDGSSIGVADSYVFENITGNHTIDVTFSPTSTVTHTITASAGTNGTISPTGSVTVAAGGSSSFTITPNGGFIIDDVFVDGNSVGPMNSYTFTNVTSNRTISCTFTNAPSVSGLLIHYKMDDPANSLTVTDSSGNGYDATIASGSGWLPTGGKYDGAVDIGGQRYITVPTNAFVGLSEVTICCWLKDATTDAGFFRGVASITNGIGALRVLEGTAGITTNLFFAGYTGGNYSARSLSPSQLGNPAHWEHWTLTAKPGDTMKVYLNGVEIASRTLETNRKIDAIESFLIGRTTSNFKGKIDDFRVYGKVLNTSELTAVINNSTSTIDTTTDSDQDGIVDFLEDAFGTDPNTPDAPTATDLLSVDNGGNVNYTVYNVTIGYQFYVDISSNLVDWVNYTNLNASGNTSALPVPASHAIDGKLFIRTRVEK